MLKEDFSKLLCMHQKYLHHLAYGRLQSIMDAEDAVQGTFLRAWIYFDRLKNEEVFSAWLTRILINECNNIMRKKRRNLRVCIYSNLDKPFSISQENQILTRLDFYQAFHHLNECYRIPIQLIFVHGLTTEETALILDITCSAVSGMVRRGREKLRAIAM